jgi:hypothetical protein
METTGVFASATRVPSFTSIFAHPHNKKIDKEKKLTARWCLVRMGRAPFGVLGV